MNDRRLADRRKDRTRRSVAELLPILTLYVRGLETKQIAYQLKKNYSWVIRRIEKIQKI